MKKKNNYYSESNEINLEESIKLIWKNKILVLFITIVFGLLGCLYKFILYEEFRSIVSLKSPPPQLFISYNSFREYGQYNYYDKFNYDLDLNLLSKDNLDEFISQSKIKNEYYSKIKFFKFNKKYSSSLDEAQNLEEKKKISYIANSYFLIFPKEIQGDILLDNYIKFTKNKTLIELKKNIKEELEYSLLKYNAHLNIALDLNLIEPAGFFGQPFKIENQDLSLFSRGTKVLSQEIILINNLYKKLDDNLFDYNHILEKPSKPRIVEPFGTHVYLLLGLTIGFFLSLMIVFIKNIFKKE
jgi:LPS O-antigen subunit length determinant protein (WzzB/FepE family)